MALVPALRDHFSAAQFATSDNSLCTIPVTPSADQLVTCLVNPIGTIPVTPSTDQLATYLVNLLGTTLLATLVNLVDTNLRGTFVWFFRSFAAGQHS